MCLWNLALIFEVCTMNHSEIFGEALWVRAEDNSICPVIRTNFEIKEKVKKATLRILGFGTYVFYVNGKLGTDDLFQPLSSNFEDRNFPKGEVMAVRSYVNMYDVTDLVKEGMNVIATMLGNGWYDGTRQEKPYGERKLCLSLAIETESGVSYVGTSLNDKYADSFVKKSNILEYEIHDYTDWDSALLSNEYDDSALPSVVAAKAPETEYFYSDCQRDGVVEIYTPKVVSKIGDATVYDAGMNIAAIPVLRSLGKAGKIRIDFSEELTADGDVDGVHSAWQCFEATVGEEPVEIKNVFSWYGFRYFKITGPAEAVSVLRTHAKVDVTSSFKSSDETLNWIYNAYLNTQRCNMHHGMPSDCPHIERRGYTGDGQLTCRSAMHILDIERFYTKWMEDISDCQDRLSGHVQYTAPYTHSGGGPGGWGAAIVILPYEMWRHYGDDTNLERFYPQMLRYFDYLDSHSENMLVNSDTPGEWCLGEWCTPGPVILPAPFVNNYFYIKALEKTIEIAEHIGKTDDIPMLQARMDERKNAINVAYYNPWDSNYLGMVQGANAFALDIGLGDEKTKSNFISYYEELGHYDTGIFGTDIVTRLLFEYGRADIAVKLMTANEPYGFGKWQKDGASTLWEYWYNSRSHSHPMFGAVATYLFEYLLGIKQDKSSQGFDSISISPMYVDGLDMASGHIITRKGKIYVKYEKISGKIVLTVSVPDGINVKVTTPYGAIVELTKATEATFM